MEPSSRPPKDVAVPARSLTALRNALREEAGPLAAIHALQAAGWEAGRDFHEGFEDALGTPSDDLAEDDFWEGLAAFLRIRGWGTLRHSRPHPGVGLLRSLDWVESDDAEDETQPTCSFSSGMLAGFLSRAAGGPIAVLQVACRGRGDEACSFAFGSEATIHELYGLLLEDGTFEQALQRL
ncbi:MAG: hypothetical protein PVI57_08950 [Gemmatimonadota bacterium]|jgi:hypothetical protein